MRRWLSRSPFCLLQTFVLPLLSNGQDGGDSKGHCCYKFCEPHSIHRQPPVERGFMTLGNPLLLHQSAAVGVMTECWSARADGGSRSPRSSPRRGDSGSGEYDRCRARPRDLLPALSHFPILPCLYSRRNDNQWNLPRFVCGRDWHSPGELEQILLGGEF